MNNVEKLLKTLGYEPEFNVDNWTIEHQYISGMRKWVGNILPSELLVRDLKSAIESILTLSQDGVLYAKFPNEVLTPDYGDNWGVTANYIEINNRAIAEMEGNITKNGILSSIKILPAIPPSAKSWANCIILSQIFPNIYGDGYNKPAEEENSIYGIKLNAGYSRNIINTEIERIEISDDKRKTEVKTQNGKTLVVNAFSHVILEFNGEFFGEKNSVQNM